MPKGVEHKPIPGGLFDPGLVPNSVMPKGVEHTISAPGSDLARAVPNSVMPKGVEHALLIAPRAPRGHGCRIQ